MVSNQENLIENYLKNFSFVIDEKLPKYYISMKKEYENILIIFKIESKVHIQYHGIYRNAWM